ncbi:MAG: hypothetical protein V5804_16400 [Mucilaginibacter sp.]|uniref:hypothetical protein n=1 Tax=Mucilaginibacter sp. TaxID=1882438 RepID=UPI0034E3813C
MKSISINYWLKAIKIVLWISLIGFGLTLFNTAGLVFTNNKMFADVRLKNAETTSLAQAELKTNRGVLAFKSDNVLDRLVFQHVYGYHDFIQSFFTFITCCILLITIKGIDPNSPFTLTIAKRISIIGSLYIIYGLVSIGAGFYLVSRVEAIMKQVTGDYTSFRDDLSNIKVGIFILIFAFIYKICVTYQEENRLTV